MPVKTLDPKKHSIIFGSPIKGFADGTYINIEPSSDVWARTTGADGLTTRVRQNDDTATITITLMQSSDSNDILSAILTADKLSGAGIIPILIKDNSGRSVFSAPEAWIAAKPAQGAGKDVENREWVIHTGEAFDFIGGN